MTHRQPTKAEILKTLEAQARAKRENKLKSFQPYPVQAAFLASTALPHQHCGLQAGNQVGKSTTAAYAVAVHATGLYPDWWQGRKFNGPTRGWVASESSVSTRDVAQALLCGPPGNDEAFGTGFIPRSMLLKPALSHGASGAFDNIPVRHVNGGISTIGFKSYEMAPGKFQSATLDWIWLDEEPPQEILVECLARLIATSGLLMVTFTPLYGTGRIVPFFRQSNPQRSLTRASMDDAKHLQDPEKREAILNTFPSYQRGARLRGEPLLGSGAVFEGVDLESLLEPLQIRQSHFGPGRLEVYDPRYGTVNTETWRFLFGLDFGINEDHAFGCVLIGHEPEMDVIHILEELKLVNMIPAQHAAAMKRIGANVKASWPHDGNSRDRGSGEQLAAIYKREGLLMNSTHAQFESGGYSTEAGVLEMITRMRAGKLKIAKHLVQWRDEALSYHRKDGVIVKSNDDLLSATRIGIMDVRNARIAVLGPTKADRSGGQNIIAANAELSGSDLF